MAQYADPREIKTPEPRPAREEAVERKEPPKPEPKEVFTDWAMI